MLHFNLKLTNSQMKTLKERLTKAEKSGDMRCLKRILVILGFADGTSQQDLASILKVSCEGVRLWLCDFLLRGIASLKRGKSPGRPSKLTKQQRRELAQIIEQGPAKAGFIGNCWRSPMIQHLIHEKFNVFYNVHYISELLKNMGFSFQKVRFIADHIDEENRQIWLEKTWPEIMKKAKEKKAYVLFGDEVSFPQWGSLSYTWAKRGQQPTIKTSGTRKGYKIFGLIDYFTGKFFYKSQEGRFNSVSYIDFLKDIIRTTKKQIILIQDGARYHTSRATTEFFEKQSDRLTVYQLPTYSPDYNPIEKLWKKIKQGGTHLHYFPTF